MELNVSRHCEAEHNAKMQYSSILDILFNEKSFAQTNDLTLCLSGNNINIVIISPMIFVNQTSGIVCIMLNLRYMIHKQLSKHDLGIFESLTFYEIHYINILLSDEKIIKT